MDSFNWCNGLMPIIRYSYFSRLSHFNFQPVLAARNSCNYTNVFARTTFIFACRWWWWHHRLASCRISDETLRYPDWPQCVDARASSQTFDRSRQCFKYARPFRSRRTFVKPSTVARKGRKGMKCRREHILVQQIERNGFVSYFVFHEHSHFAIRLFHSTFS